MIVVDASVFVKLFRDEEGSDKTETLFRRHLGTENGLMAPTILPYEALSAALHYEQSFVAVGELIARLREGGFELVEPAISEIAKAEEITTTLSPIGGYPALSDSMYHAIAICRGGVLVTADQRHFAKTKHLGSVVLLSDWRSE